VLAYDHGSDEVPWIPCSLDAERAAWALECERYAANVSRDCLDLSKLPVGTSKEVGIYQGECSPPDQCLHHHCVKQFRTLSKV
jgi:hypothetical protein